MGGIERDRERERPPADLSPCTVRTVLADFAVFHLWGYCKTLCDVKFSKIEGNGRKCRYI